MPTMQDVAELSGVSRQLVSMVLRGAPGPGEKSRERVLRAAAELGFRPNLAARQLRQARTRLIGVTCAITNGFQARFAQRLLERAPESSLGIVLAPHSGIRTTDVLVNELLGFRVEALACFTPEPDAPALQRALGLMPVVWLGERSGDPRASSVSSDDAEGLRGAIAHLVALGHRDIVYFGGLGRTIGPDRERSYRAAMRAVGLGERSVSVEMGFEPEEGAAAARTLLASHRLPTAIVCCSDQVAAAVQSVLRHAGVRVPEDVSIIGYDDGPVAAQSFTALTSIRQDVDITVDAVLRTIEAKLADPAGEPTHVLTPAPLTLRASTGTVRSTTVS